jgi:hypothetical protein
MQEKTITIIIDEQGSSTRDLVGFAGQGCEKVFDDFRGGDSVKVEERRTGRPRIAPEVRSSPQCLCCGFLGLFFSLDKRNKIG